jgi:hypothetical protein
MLLWGELLPIARSPFTPHSGRLSWPQCIYFNTMGGGGLPPETANFSIAALNG